MDEEYINDENDPTSVEVIKEKEIPIKDDELINDDDVLATVKTSIKSIKKYDELMEKKVLNMLYNDLLE